MKSISRRSCFRLSILSAALLQVLTFKPVYSQDQSTAEYRWWVTQVKANTFHTGSYQDLDGIPTSALGQGITIAVVDTGVARHTEFSSRLLPGYSDWGGDGRIDVNGHGTHVAGIAAAGLDASGIVGIAPEALILPVKVLSDRGSGSGTTLYRGVNWAVNNYVKPTSGTPLNRTVFSMSLGSSKAFGLDSLRLIKNSGSIAVIAAGNSGGSNPIYPASYATDPSVAGSIIVVGAVDSANRMASWSNRAGSTANYYLVAPGVDIYSTNGTTSYKTLSGTSMATPLVSGGAALVWGAWPYLQPTQVIHSLLWSATDLGTRGVDTTFGWGLLNLEAAMSPIGQTCVATVSNACATEPVVTHPPTSPPTTPSTPPVATPKPEPAPKKRFFRRSLTASFAMPSASGLAAVESNARVIGYDSLGRHFELPISAAISTGGLVRSAHVLDQWLLAAEPLRQIAESLATKASIQGSEARGFTGLWMTQSVSDHGSLNLFRGQSVLPFGPGHRRDHANSFVGNDAMKIPHLGLIEDPVGMSHLHHFAKGAVSTQFGLVSGFSTRPVNDLNPFDSQVSRGATAAAIGEVALNHSGFGLVITMGLMNEAGSFLGASTQDERTSGHSSFANLAAMVDMGRGLSASATATFGRSHGQTESGDVRYKAQTLSTSFGLMKKALFIRDDVFTLSWSQPNRIDQGDFSLHAAVDVNMESGAPIFGVIPVSMVPSGREQRWTLGWASPVGKQSSVGLTAMRRLQPNHNALAKPEDVAGIRFTRDF